MNIKMATHSQLSTIESKNRLSKQAEGKQNHRYGDHLEGYQLWGKGENEGKGYKIEGCKVQSRK